MTLTTEQKRMLIRADLIGWEDDLILQEFESMKKGLILWGASDSFIKDFDAMKTIEEKRNGLYKCFGAFPDETIQFHYESNKKALALAFNCDSAKELEEKATEYFRNPSEAIESFFRKNPSA